MSVGVIDAGVVITWLRRGRRSAERADRLFRGVRERRVELYISVVNLAEVLLHTADFTRESGVDPVALLRAWGVVVHRPDETVARRVARLDTSLADGFAAATAIELGGRLHTTDAELVRQLKGTGLPVTHY